MATRKYLLSTGETTRKVEEYILDLFKLYLQVNPGDIPWAPTIGYDFTLLDVTKDRLKSEVEFRVKQLVRKIQERFGSISITVNSIELLDEQTARVVIDVDGKAAQTYSIDLYENS